MMIYPNYYPQAQMPQMQPQLQQQIPQPQMVQQPQVQQPQIQNGGYVIVQNEEEVRRYPVAHGNVVTFRIENQPIVIEKSMGFSQFDTPHYEKYKLIKEDMEEAEVVDHKEYLLKTEYEKGRNEVLEAQNEIFSHIKDLKRQIEALEKKPATRKKEGE